jgi:hypothetical protein
MHPILQQIYNSVQSASSILQQIHVEQCTKCNHVATNVHNSVHIATSYADLRPCTNRKILQQSLSVLSATFLQQSMSVLSGDAISQDGQPLVLWFFAVQFYRLLHVYNTFP